MPAGQGLQYMLTMEKEHQADDTVLRMNGVEFLLDSDSAPFLEEATIDYVEEFGGRVGFVINNPDVLRRWLRQRQLLGVVAAAAADVAAMAAVAAAAATRN